jgi:hypothetical protein
MRAFIPIYHQLTPTSMLMYHVEHVLVRVTSDDAYRSLHVLHMQPVLLYVALDQPCYVQQ